MKIAFVTGGGDSAGINSALARAVLHGREKYQASFIGVRRAFEGLASDNIEEYLLPLDEWDAHRIFCAPSTILGSSRFAPFSEENKSWAPEKIQSNMKKLGIDAILATGGNDTIGSAMHLHDFGIPIIGIPKSIDNDISGTDWMLGASTAVDFAREAFRSSAVSAETHARVSVNEIMGRKAGWLAYLTGISTKADIILVPEKAFSLQALVDRVKKLQDQNKSVNIVVSEGINFNQEDPLFKKALSPESEDQVLRAMLSEKPEYDEHGNIKLGGVGVIIQRILAMGLKCSLSAIRQSNIGFSLRGLTPNAFDIILGQRFGHRAMELLMDKQSGIMVGIRGKEIVSVPMIEALPQYTLDALSDEELDAFGVFFTP